MKAFLAIACGLAVLGTASAETMRVSQDATVTYNDAMCLNNTVRCDTITKGQDTYVLTFKNYHDDERVLLGFNLPAQNPQKCILHIPKPLYTSVYQLTVSATDNNWDEATVCGANKAKGNTEIATVNSPANTVDVSWACRAATGQRLSLFVATAGDVVSFNSAQSASQDVFELEYQL